MNKNDLSVCVMHCFEYYSQFVSSSISSEFTQKMLLIKFYKKRILKETSD